MFERLFGLNACWNFVPYFNVLVPHAFLKSDCFIKRNVKKIWVVLEKGFTVKVGDVDDNGKLLI